ncbi:mCG113170, partial [Mus musculus]
LAAGRRTITSFLLSFFSSHSSGLSLSPVSLCPWVHAYRFYKSSALHLPNPKVIWRKRRSHSAPSWDDGTVPKRMGRVDLLSLPVTHLLLWMRPLYIIFVPGLMIFFFSFLAHYFSVLWLEPRASCMLGSTLLRSYTPNPHLLKFSFERRALWL